MCFSSGGALTDCLDIWVQNRAFGIGGLAVAIGCACGIEASGELELGLGRDMALVLEHQDLVVEESITNDVELSIYRCVSRLMFMQSCGFGGNSPARLPIQPGEGLYG